MMTPRWTNNRVVRGSSIFAKSKGAGAIQSQLIASTHGCDGFCRLKWVIRSMGWYGRRDEVSAKTLSTHHGEVSSLCRRERYIHNYLVSVCLRSVQKRSDLVTLSIYSDFLSLLPLKMPVLGQLNTHLFERLSFSSLGLMFLFTSSIPLYSIYY